MSRASELRELIATELADVHTCLPGTVVSYDGRSAVVKPAISKQLSSGDELPAPTIVSVPVCWPCGDVGGGQALISVPLKAGDAVLLHFSERSLENWLSGRDGVPGDPRMFDLSDAFATPVCRPGALQADPDSVTVQYGGAVFRMGAGGEVSIDTPAQVSITAGAGVAITGDVTVQGRIDATDDVTGAGVSLQTHRHTAVQPGGGTSGPPA